MLTERHALYAGLADEPDSGSSLEFSIIAALPFGSFIVGFDSSRKPPDRLLATSSQI